MKLTFSTCSFQQVLTQPFFLLFELSLLNLVCCSFFLSVVFILIVNWTLQATQRLISYLMMFSQLNLEKNPLVI